MPTQNYNFHNELVRVVDGDTVEMRIDLGFEVTVQTMIRLAGINAPEMRGEEKEKGILAKIYLEDLFLLHPNPKLVVLGKGKYGRWIADFVYGSKTFAEQMILAGHAVQVNYGSETFRHEMTP